MFKKIEAANDISIEIRILLLSVGLIVFGFAGFFAFHDFGTHYFFAHIGGLGIIGHIGCWAGIIARNKGYSYWKAFLWGFIFPTFIGIVSVLFVHALGERGCGGIVSIIAAIFIVIYYLFTRKKPAKDQFKP